MLAVDQTLDQIDDPLLACSGGVELTAHIDEAAVNVIPEIAEVLSKIGEVLSYLDEVRPQCVETRGRRLAEVTYLSSDLAGVTVCSASQYPSRRGVLLDGSESSADVAEITLAHSSELTGANGIGVP